MKMKGFFVTACAGLGLAGLALLLSAPAWSGGWSYSNAGSKKEGTWFGENADGKFMLGAKYGVVKNGLEGADDAKATGLVLGYHFARPVDFNGTASIEFEYLKSSTDGVFGANSAFGQAGTWDFDAWNIFFAYRTPGMVFFKAKLGGMNSDVTYKNPNGDSRSDELAFAWGAGLGVKLGDMFLAELEYTATTGDNELEYISLGGILEF